MRLALTDFNEYMVFYRNCMWLQVSQIEKKFTEGNVRKLAFIFACDVTKIKKTRIVSRVGIHLGAPSRDTMYRMRESKSKLELFYQLPYWDLISGVFNFAFVAIVKKSRN